MPSTSARSWSLLGAEHVLGALEGHRDRLVERLRRAGALSRVRAWSVDSPPTSTPPTLTPSAILSELRAVDRVGARPPARAATPTAAARAICALRPTMTDPESRRTGRRFPRRAGAQARRCATLAARRRLARLRSRAARDPRPRRRARPGARAARAGSSAGTPRPRARTCRSARRRASPAPGAGARRA